MKVESQSQTEGRPIDDLQELGFTGLEAEVYIHLAQGEASTGYAIARALNKPTANTYKAIAALEAKGAVIVDDGDTRACWAASAWPMSWFMRR